VERGRPFFYGNGIGEIKQSANRTNAFEITTKEGQKITKEKVEARIKTEPGMVGREEVDFY
jgi:hypothetical protein